MAKAPHRPRSQKQKVADLRRGDLYLCSFDPTIGHEIRKTRPALVIQNDIGNRFSPLTIVAAITSTVSSVPYPVEAIIEPTASNGLDVRSSIRLDQIRTVDRIRLMKKLGQIDTGVTLQVEQAIRVAFGLP